jgi:hypothetical protein
MSEEEMQRKMEFIIEQQAQFAVNIDLLRCHKHYRNCRNHKCRCRGRRHT